MTIRVRFLIALAVAVAVALPVAIFERVPFLPQPLTSVVACEECPGYVYVRGGGCARCAAGEPHDLADHVDPSGGVVDWTVGDLNGEHDN